MTITIDSFLMILLLLIIPPLTCVASVILSERWYKRHERDAMKAREKAAAADEAKLLGWAEALAVQELSLDDREDALLVGQQGLRRRAKEVEAAIHAEEERYDTVLDLEKVDELPHPYQDHPTVVMDAVTEEER